MHEELSVLRQRYEDVIAEHSTALLSTKTAAREEVKNETEELDRRLREATESEAKLRVCVSVLHTVASFVSRARYYQNK